MKRRLSFPGGSGASGRIKGEASRSSRVSGDQRMRNAKRSAQGSSRASDGSGISGKSGVSGSGRVSRRSTAAGKDAVSRRRSVSSAGRSAAGRFRRAAGGTSGRRPPRHTGKRLTIKQKLLVAGGIAVALILVYCIIANSYRSRFLPHTYINSFDVSSLSNAEAEEILKKSVENYSLELGFRGGSIRTLNSEDVDLTYVSSNEVQEILAGQNRAGWIRNAFGRHTSYTVSTSFKFDTEKLRSYLESLPEFQEANITKPADAHIVKKVNNTFKVASEVDGNQPVEDAVLAAVDKAINHSEARLNLASVEGAYAEPQVRADNEDLNYTVERFNTFVNTKINITTRDGKVQSYGRDQLIDWFKQDESTGTWSLSKESVYKRCWAIMQDIADRYDDAKSTVEYVSQYDGTVVLPCARYGYLVDVEAETDKMNDALLAREDRDIQIENSVTETIDPTNGGTYVEVDITNQLVTYFENGEIRLQTECVSGKESDPERRTPSGVFSVLNKLENQTLGSLTATDPGQRYESHVDVWMPFFESYGMHDASWREEFGGTRYLSYGSHGCVNLPPEDAVELFKMIDYYTPVIVVRAGDNAPEGTQRGSTTWNPPEGGLHYSEEDE